MSHGISIRWRKREKVEGKEGEDDEGKVILFIIGLFRRREIKVAGPADIVLSPLSFITTTGVA